MGMELVPEPEPDYPLVKKGKDQKVNLNLDDIFLSGIESLSLSLIWIES